MNHCSHFDADCANLQDEILRIWGTGEKTVVLITNDVDEGLLMADRDYSAKSGAGGDLRAGVCDQSANGP